MAGGLACLAKMSKTFISLDFNEVYVFESD